MKASQLLLLIITVAVQRVAGKVIEERVTLSGDLQFIGKFAFQRGNTRISHSLSPNGYGKNVTVFLIMDELWDIMPHGRTWSCSEPEMLNAKANNRGILTRDMNQHKRVSMKTQLTGWGATVNHSINSHLRIHFWYAMLANCTDEAQAELQRRLNPESLQINKPPEQPPSTVDVRIAFYNGEGWFHHFGADEFMLFPMSLLVLFLQAALVVIGGTRISPLWVTWDPTQKLVVLGCGAGVCLQLISNLLEALHLVIYNSNGVGSPLLDTLSGLLHETSQSVLSTIFLLIACGWLLVSRSLPVATALPVAVAVSVAHVVLFLSGEAYDGTAHKYHNYETLWGGILLLSRVAAAAYLAVQMRNTHAEVPLSSRSFCVALGGCCCAWMLATPILVFISIFLPAYLRHQIVHSATHLLQLLFASAAIHLLLGSRTKFWNATILSSILPASFTAHEKV